jgi:uncharacterized integral membrane protein
VSGPVLPYESEPPSNWHTWARVASWLAIACGIPFWCIAIYVRVFHLHLTVSRDKEWIAELIALLFVPGIVLGLAGVIWSDGRSVAGWVGLLINLSIFGVVGYAYLTHH